ncbi:hypothetical protein JTB14_004489 [Gonioctena quinquepunctata]|nr:hypothetical protein JTB14_004489 [Gonioctena quinquepunctata]
MVYQQKQLKLPARNARTLFLKLLDGLLCTQDFPRVWKEAKLVLLWKGRALKGASDFRPTCLLNMLVKLFEHPISERLTEAVEENGDLSTNQNGFRKNKSTMLAISKIGDGSIREMSNADDDRRGKCLQY